MRLKFVPEAFPRMFPHFDPEMDGSELKRTESAPDSFGRNRRWRFALRCNDVTYGDWAIRGEKP